MIQKANPTVTYEPEEDESSVVETVNDYVSNSDNAEKVLSDFEFDDFDEKVATEIKYNEIIENNNKSEDIFIRDNNEVKRKLFLNNNTHLLVMT